ncbi:MAG: hypothetical protein RID07_09800, partial [Lacipirellulaceae bacterium]
KTTVDLDKAIPAPEDVCEIHAANLKRRDEIQTALKRLADREREVLAEIAEDRGMQRRSDEISAILGGTDYDPPAPFGEELGKIARQRKLLNEELHIATCAVTESHRSASAKIVNEFQPEQRALAEEFFQHLVAAVKVHASFGKMKDRLEANGVSAAGLHDFGKDLMGLPNRRNDHACYSLRDGVRRGYLDKADVPAGYL